MVGETQIWNWAVRQLADYDARRPGMLFAEGLRLDVADAYRLQSAVTQLRLERGERTIGYKVGCTSPKIRAQLGIDHRVTGRLFDSEQHDSGSALSRQRYASLAIEGELAVELSRTPVADDFLGTAIPACVSRVFPVIELHHHIMRGDLPSAGELVANNAIHAGFVAGRGVTREEISEDSGQTSLLIFADDQLLETCEGGALIETLHASLTWLTRRLQDVGELLAAGQIVLTGSVPSLIPIHGDCRIRVDAPPLGRVEASFIP